MHPPMSSRERMLRALCRQDVDHVPCAFMSFSAMRARCQDAYEVAERELEMGLDSFLFIPSSWRNERRLHPDLRGLPVRFPPDIRADLWLEHDPAHKFPVLHKVYHTPAGTLSTAVLKGGDWPHGNFIPFVDDYQVPRAIKRLVTGPEDLPALRALLVAPHEEDVALFRREARRARAFCAQKGVLLVGGWGVAADMAAWLCGLEAIVLDAMDRPAFLAELLEIIRAWNEQRMCVLLEERLDLFIRRGWYEGADYWSPRLYDEFLLPTLKREAQLAHEHGALFGYIMTTGALPMLERILAAGVDVLIGADPLQRGERPLEAMRDSLGGRVCIWGGVNGAITVEEGSEEDVRRAVEYALGVMRGTRGFILSPVDNITEITRNTWRNVDVFIETWKRLW